MKLVLKKDNLCYIVNNWGLPFAPEKFYIRPDEKNVEFYKLQKTSKKKIGYYEWCNSDSSENYPHLRITFTRWLW